MIVKSDQDQVRALLIEAITVLCKKKLSFKSQLNVEGLIGITLDADDIFLVSIKEVILQSEVSTTEEGPQEDTEIEMSMPVSVSSTGNDSVSTNGSKMRTGRQRKSTPRHLSVVSPPLQYDIENPTEEDEEECSWLLQDGTDIDDLRHATQNTNHIHRNGYHTTSSTVTLADANCNNSNNNKDIPHEIQENGIDAPLNLSNSSNRRLSCDIDIKPHRDITPQKRKRYDSGDTDSQCSSTFSGSLKRPSSVSNISSLSPARTTPTLELVSIKQEPNLETPFNNNHHFETQTNGYLFHQQMLHGKSEVINNSFGNGVMKDTGNILAGRTSLIESAIWQRLASPIAPLQLTSPILPSQDSTKLVENGELHGRLNESQPVLKVPLYSITGKLKKENKPAVPEKMPIKEATNTTNTLERLLAKENGNNNSPNLVIDFEKKHMIKKVESKVMSKGGSLDSDTSDKLDHSYADFSSVSDSVLDHSDGYHSFQTDSTDQENIEVFSVDSDDDVKTEDFIDRSQEPGKAVSYKCKLCDRVYSNKWNCRRHIQYTHMNKTGFTCEICHNKYRDRSDYQEHLQIIHNGPGGYKCEFCDKILMSKRSLKEHVSLHTGQYRYHCIECGRGFNRLNDYQLHMTKDHGTNLAAVTSAEMMQMLVNSQKTEEA